MRKKTYFIVKVMKRMLELFGHIARIDNGRKIKSVVMDKMDRYNRKGTPYPAGVA